ncbi:MAG: hypothetical protein HQK97_01300 [Nitrospirae bacterium]|nr:hypothetical protein [Nitrospirota bacterium]
MSGIEKEDITLSEQYHLQNARTGLYVEVYLPTERKDGNSNENICKSLYTFHLKDILNKGLNISYVKENILKEEFKNFLKDYSIYNKIYPETGDANPDMQLIDKMSETFHGYSIYGVDGTFKSSNGIDRDHSLVTRIMFLPDFENIRKCINFNDKSINDKKINQMIEFYLKFDRLMKYWKGYGNEKNDDNNPAKYEPDYVELRKYIRRWSSDVTIFVFCYFMFNICSRIINLKKECLCKEIEREIWVTSFWDIAVNSAILTK